MVSFLFYFYKEISVGQGGPAEERGEGSTKRQHKIMNNLNFHCHHLPVAEGEEKRRVTGEERVLGSREKGHMPLNKHKVQLGKGITNVRQVALESQLYCDDTSTKFLLEAPTRKQKLQLPLRRCVPGKRVPYIEDYTVTNVPCHVLYAAAQLSSVYSVWSTPLTLNASLFDFSYFIIRNT